MSARAPHRAAAGRGPAVFGKRAARVAASNAGAGEGSSSSSGTEVDRRALVVSR